jgi:hypothetical protein
MPKRKGQTKEPQPITKRRKASVEQEIFDSIDIRLLALLDELCTLLPLNPTSDSLLKHKIATLLQDHLRDEDSTLTLTARWTEKEQARKKKRTAACSKKELLIPFDAPLLDPAIDAAQELVDQVDPKARAGFKVSHDGRGMLRIKWEVELPYPTVSEEDANDEKEEARYELLYRENHRLDQVFRSKDSSLVSGFAAEVIQRLGALLDFCQCRIPVDNLDREHMQKAVDDYVLPFMKKVVRNFSYKVEEPSTSSEKVYVFEWE